MKSEIINILKTKSKNKQLVYSNTKTFFENLKEKLIQTEKYLTDKVTSSNKEIEIKYLSSGNFEAMLQLSGETLLFNMHSNVFDLPKNHAFKNSDYLKNDVERSFCGIINIYNFIVSHIVFFSLFSGLLLLSSFHMSEFFGGPSLVFFLCSTCFRTGTN